MSTSPVTPRLRPLLLMMILGLSACASTSPPVEFFTLSPVPSPARPDPGREDVAITIGPVAFPEFLDRPQIVSRPGPHRLDVAEFYRWGGSVEGEFLRVLGENLGMLLGTDRIVVYPADAPFALDYRITADVLRFEPTAAGKALLKVRWILTDDHSGQVLAVRTSTIERALGGAEGDYAGDVAALSAALGAFSEEVAAEVRRVAR